MNEAKWNHCPAKITVLDDELLARTKVTLVKRERSKGRFVTHCVWVFAHATRVSNIVSALFLTPELNGDRYISRVENESAIQGRFDEGNMIYSTLSTRNENCGHYTFKSGGGGNGNNS